MISLLFIHGISLIKIYILLLVKLFTVSYISAKILTLVFLMFVLYLLWKYPRQRFHKLSRCRNYKYNLIMKYAMKTKIQRIYNIIILVAGFNFMIVFIFLLRYSNKGKILDLLEKYESIKYYILNSSFLEVVINIILVLIIFITYIVLMVKISKYIKFHMIKLHLYLLSPLGSSKIMLWYEVNFCYKFLKQYNLHEGIYNFIRFIEDVYEKYYFNKRNTYDYYNYKESEKIDWYTMTPLHPICFVRKYKIDRLIFHAFTKWHYILLFILFVYDCYFNSYKINLIFTVLPWLMFFELYLRFSTFADDLWLDYDSLFSKIIYARSLELITKDDILIDGEFHDYNLIKIMYHKYIKRGFVKDYNYLT